MEHCKLCDCELGEANTVWVQWKDYSPKAESCIGSPEPFCRACWNSMLKQNRVGDSFGRYPLRVNGIDWEVYKRTVK